MSTVAVKTLEGSSLERVRHAARELFVQQGYHETRPQDIARRAGVANGTFYLHFADKLQAFLDFAERAQDELLALLGERLAGVEGSRARWVAICDSVVAFADSHPGLLQAAFVDPVFIAPNDENAWRMHDRLGHLVSLALADEAGTRSLQASADLALISHGVCGFLRQALTYAHRRGLDRQKTIDDLSSFIDRGLY